MLRSRWSRSGRCDEQRSERIGHAGTSSAGAKPGDGLPGRRRSVEGFSAAPLALDLVNRVLAVVVDERAVLIPVRAAASAGQLLRTDHHVIDVVLMGKLKCACIPVKDSLVVLTLLDIVGQAVGP